MCLAKSLLLYLPTINKCNKRFIIFYKIVNIVYGRQLCSCISKLLAVKLILFSEYHIARELFLFFLLNPNFTLHHTMKFLVIFSLLMVTLLARNRKYLVEVENKNEIIDEKKKNQNDKENVLNYDEKNAQQNKAFLLTHYCEHYPATMVCQFHEGPQGRLNI